MEDRYIQDFLRRLPGDKLFRLAVRTAPNAEDGRCYWNVESQLSQPGDRIIFGWRIVWWEGYLIEAVHHAVLGRGNLLFDVGPWKESSILFKRHDISIDYNRGERVPKILEPIYMFQPLNLLIAYELTIDSERTVRMGKLARGESVFEHDTVIQHLNKELRIVQEEMLHAIAIGKPTCLCGSEKPYGDCHGQLFPTEAEARAFDGP